MEPKAFVVLVVEDDLHVARSVVRIAAQVGEAVIASSVAAAEAALARHREWGAFVVDVELPDGDGLLWLARARRKHPLTPAAVFSGRFARGHVNAATDLNAEYIEKASSYERIDRFLRGAASRRDAIAEAVAMWAGRHGIARREADTFCMSARGQSVEEIAEARKRSPLTVRDQTRAVREKTGDLYFKDAVMRLLREAALGRSRRGGA
jgi:DNA-binding NarL/FixJ family response regulator